MKLVNATKMQAGCTMGLQPDGRELLVVVVKGTFTIPPPGEEAKLAEEQAPLVDADVFTGEPGFSAPLYEADFAPRKPRCDILLNGSAYAPGGKPTDRVRVSLRIGSLAKSFDAVGNRVWKAGALFMAASSPEPFTVMPISYNNAFGGVDKAKEDPQQWRFYPLNHAGVGYHEYTSGKFMDGKPLPNTEERGGKVTNPKGSYRPMAFGPVGRGWQPRPKLAGTYDKHWQDNVFPFLPADFKEEYYQAAPADQQMTYPQGGEEVVLENLTPNGNTSFKLPQCDLPIEFVLRNGSPREVRPVIDTVVIEPELKRFLVVWRTNHLLRRNIFEVAQVIAGKMSPGWYRARATGKQHYRSLKEMMMSKERGT